MCGEEGLMGTEGYWQGWKRRKKEQEGGREGMNMVKLDGESGWD